MRKKLPNRMINWDAVNEHRYMMMPFSEDFKGSIERYLIHGLEPGGFATAMLAADMERALYNADTHNRRVFWAIAMWIRENMPPGSWGSYEAVEGWCRDRDNRRTKWTEEYNKEQVWLTLVK